MSNYAVHNPNTGEIQEQFDSLAPECISGVIERAHAAFIEWSATSMEERTAILERFADLVEGEADGLARIIGREIGKPLARSTSSGSTSAGMNSRALLRRRSRA